jgi:drug/metabolite transporter (DMT)-like permease
MNTTPAFTIIAYLTCSCSMIVINKSILSACQFPYPFLMISIHMATATLVTQIMEKCNWLPAVQDNKVSFQVYTQQIVPIAALFSITLVCGNLSYLYLTVSFVQMLKACTPICVLLLSILMGLEQPNKVQLMLVGGLSLGVVVSTSGEQNFNSTGFAYEIVSIVAEALRLTLSGKLVKTVKLDATSMLYYVAPLGFVGIFISFFYFELPTFLEDEAYQKLDNGFLPLLLLVSSLIAFACNIASVHLIISTSPVVLSLVGVLKDLLILFFSMVVFRSPVTVVQMTSYLATLLFLQAYKDYKRNPVEFIARIDTFLFHLGLRGSAEGGLMTKWAMTEVQETNKAEKERSASEVAAGLFKGKRGKNSDPHLPNDLGSAQQVIVDHDDKQ